MGDQNFYRKPQHSGATGNISGDPLFGKGESGKTSAQIISEAKASIIHKKSSVAMVVNFVDIVLYNEENSNCP